MRLDCFAAEDLANRALHQGCQTLVPRRRTLLARMPGQQPCRPQLVRIAMLLGLVARQRHQPSLGLRRDRRLLAGSRAVFEGCQRTVGDRPFDAALHGLMMHSEALSHRKERQILPIAEQHLRPLDPAGRLRARARYRYQRGNLVLRHHQLNRMSPSRHDTVPRSANRKRGIRHQTIRSMSGFMESIV
jgi:hypothetical protein